MSELLRKHDSVVMDNSYFIGIACPYRYAGLTSAGYRPPLPSRYFPLVSPETMKTVLASFVTYRCPQNVKSQRLTYRHVRQNFKFIGGKELKDVSGTDHQRLHFIGGGWVEFDTGGKRDSTLIPDAWTKQICAKLKLPDDAADAIKAALIEGRPVDEYETTRLSTMNAVGIARNC
jgi:hypothetical protein